MVCLFCASIECLRRCVSTRIFHFHEFDPQTRHGKHTPRHGKHAALHDTDAHSNETTTGFGSRLLISAAMGVCFKGRQWVRPHGPNDNQLHCCSSLKSNSVSGVSVLPGFGSTMIFSRHSLMRSSSQCATKQLNRYIKLSSIVAIPKGFQWLFQRTLFVLCHFVSREVSPVSLAKKCWFGQCQVHRSFRRQCIHKFTIDGNGNKRFAFVLQMNIEIKVICSALRRREWSKWPLLGNTTFPLHVPPEITSRYQQAFRNVFGIGKILTAQGSPYVVVKRCIMKFA
mmetsp:Transcript_29186/g.52831  ORF Transcript_29186/g.52831 Transcript_29186/m.52831 type:complete len:283 (+) Transcript_29186:168-1016(+)